MKSIESGKFFRALTFLTYIREIFGSITGWDTNIAHVIRAFFSSSKQMPR
jgi:hypothetical protein